MFTKENRAGYREPIVGVMYKTLTFGDKTSLTEFLLKKGHILPKHSHPHEQTGYLVSGSILLHIGDAVYPTNPGDSWCIKGGVEHWAEILEDSVAIEVFSPVRIEYL